MDCYSVLKRNELSSHRATQLQVLCSPRPLPRAKWWRYPSFHTVVLEKTPEDPLDWKESKPVNPKGNQPWIFTGRIDAEGEAPTLWPPDVKSQITGKRLWCWKRLKVGGEGGNRGWDGWMPSPTQWTWVWVSSGRQLTGEPGVLQSTGVTKSQTQLSDRLQQLALKPWFPASWVRDRCAPQPVQAPFSLPVLCPNSRIFYDVKLDNISFYSEAQVFKALTMG